MSTALPVNLEKMFLKKSNTEPNIDFSSSFITCPVILNFAFSFFVSEVGGSWEGVESSFKTSSLVSEYISDSTGEGVIISSSLSIEGWVELTSSELSFFIFFSIFSICFSNS